MESIEIERTFLVGQPPAQLNNLKKKNIKQGYVCYSNSSEVRCRQIDDQYFLTIKGPGSLTRKETEIEITKNQFNEIWDTTEGARVYKERYQIEFGDFQIELDIYNQKLSGLILAEVEFNTLEDAENFIKPVWFGGEVTYDKRYKNRNLALNGIPVK
jgi:CYTH domain-containing protein